MATRLKTIEFAAPTLTTMSDNTLTAFAQFTAYIPEFSGTVTIRKAIVYVSAMEGATMTTGNYTSRRIDVSVGGAGATSYTNANLYTGSGENTCVFYAADATTHFTTNWTSGTSKTIDISILIDATATTLAWRNMNATVRITYEYDDTQTTHIKTVWIPLDMPVTTLAASKPGAALATIPALDTALPEASKTYRNMHIVVQGNWGTSTTDSTISMQIDSLTAYTSQSVEAGAASDYHFRLVYDITSLGMTTNATHGWYCWASTARANHLQAWLVVTYEFDASTSTEMLVSLIVPMEMMSPMCGTTSADFQRAQRELWIQETNVTGAEVAFFVFWEQAAAISGLNMRIGTGSFVTYTDAAAVLGGSNVAMIRNDAAFSLDRGRNTLNFDAYRTDATDIGTNVSGWWIVNYTCDVPADGVGAANHTVYWNMNATFDGAASAVRDIAATAPVIPETSYFLTAVGVNYQYLSNSTGTPSGVTVLARDDADEEWLLAYIDFAYTDPETGLRQCWAQTRALFERWPGDPDSSRVNIETARKWRCVLNQNCASFDYLDMVFSYHSITYDVSGSISGSGGGSVTIDLHRADSGEKVLSTSRSGDGSYAFAWYDDTENVFVSAREDATHVGRSDQGLAA